MFAPLAICVHGFALPEITFGLHMSARVAFIYFLVVYCARPVRQIMGMVWLMKHRRTFGLCVSIALSVHFVFVAAYFYLSRESIFDDMPRLYALSVAVVALYLMTITSNNASMRILGRWWKRLHTFGLHYLWLSFFIGFLIALLNLPDGSSGQAVLLISFLAMQMAGLGLRIHLSLKRRTARSQATRA